MEFLKNYEQVTKSRSKVGKYLLAAIEAEKKVSIEYVSNSGRKSKRDIIPYGVFKSKQNKFYVSGFCHKAGEERVFSLESLQIVSSDFVTGESFDETLDRYKTQEIPVCATVSCNNDVEVLNLLSGEKRFETHCRKCSSERLRADEFSQSDESDHSKSKKLNGTFSAESYREPEEDKSLISDAYDKSFMSKSIEQLRTKLLEFSRRNNLINFSQTERSRRILRVVDEVPSVLIEKLIGGGMQFIPLPDIAEEPEDEKTEEFKLALAAAQANDETYLSELEELGDSVEDEQKFDAALKDLKNRIRENLGLPIVQRGEQINIRAHALSHGFNPDYELSFGSEESKHTDSDIQTLMMPDELEKRLKSIYGNYRDVLNDKGLNIFYACFGFIKWFEHSNSDQPNSSPLVLLPIEIERKKSGRGYKYTFSSNGTEPVVNQTLLEKLNLEMGISLPQFDVENLPEEDDNDTPQNGFKSLESYFREVEEAISVRDGWSLNNWVSFGFFNYQDIVIFNDLLPENWSDSNSLFGHELVARLLGGMPANEVSSIGESRDIDELTLRGDIPHLVMPADSSQHSAILHALEGKPLVIQGPPGTGKSQTITNLIAALVTNGKRVLFLAEKQPALNVVKDRLNSVGLGDLVFDPKVSGNKAEVYESLRRRKDLRASFSEVAAEKEAQRLQKLIQESKDYESMLNANTAYCEKSLFELIWLTENALEETSGLALPFYISTSIKKISEEELEASLNLVSRYQSMLSEMSSDSLNLSGFSKLSANPLEVELLQEKAGLCSEKIQKAQSTLLDFGFSADKNTAVQLRLLNLASALVSKYEKETLSFIFNASEPEKKVRHSLSAYNFCESLEREYPFLIDLQNEDLKELFSAAENLENQIEDTPAFSEVSLQDLYERTRESDKLSENWAKFESDLFGKSKQLRELQLSKLESFLKEIWFDEFQNFYSLFVNLNAERVSQDTVEKLEKLILQISIVQSMIDNLPRSVDFDVIYKDFRIDEVETLKSDFDGIGFISKYGASAKKIKATLSLMGIDPEKKELALKWLERVIECLSEAKKLDNNPELTLIFSNKVDAIYSKHADFTLLVDGLRKILRKQSEDSSQTISGLSPAIVVELANSFEIEAEMISLVTDVIGEDKATVLLKDVSDRIALSNERSNQIVDAAKKLGVPLGITFRKIRRGRHFTEIISEYFDKKSACVLPELPNVKEEPLQSIAASLREISEALNDCELANNELLGSLVFSQESITKSKDALEEVQNELKTFGVEFSHTRYANLSFEDSLLSLEKEDSFLQMVSNSDVSTLIKSAQSLALEEEVSSSFDPDYFPLLRGLFEENEQITENQARYFFIVRVAQSVLRNHFNDNLTEIPSDLSETLGRAGSVFKDLDEKISAHAAQLAISNGCSAPSPKGIDYGPVRNWTERSLINRQLNMQRRLLGIRQLVKRATSALLGMKPIWFLNPIGVSQYLPRKNGLFDVVIIDEASQMLPEKAVAGIARANNVVVVGDNKQMPPTNWMKASVDFGEEEEEEVDAESILDLAQQRVGNSVSLRWHYRSRHPNLIRFSNHHFYDDKLEIFPTPSPSSTSLGVRGVKVKGVYKGQVNQIELEEVMLQARELMERYPDESLGIVAINRPQMELIKQALETTSDPVMRNYIDKWDNDQLNSVFVKNLDNVQGDERDNIIISTVYAPDEDGNLFQRFPSVASKNGHRRLNVLITRAKNRLILITSLNANDVKMTDNSPQGKQVFKDYIEYAMTGKLDTGVDLKKEADSDFEIAVGNMLKKAGYEVTPQVGVRGFRIDLGVSHEEFPHGYIAGIECDGATFHSSASARDRDAIRQQILEGLGWKIYRVWSTDWFTNPAREKEKLLNWLSKVWTRASNENSLSSGETDVEVKEALNSGPSGVRGILDINGQEIEYWKPVDGLYELWEGKIMIGFVEEEVIEVADANSGFAKRLAAQRVMYNTTTLIPEKKQSRHDSFEIGLRWIYQQYTEDNKN